MPDNPNPTQPTPLYAIRNTRTGQWVMDAEWSVRTYEDKTDADEWCDGSENYRVVKLVPEPPVTVPTIDDAIELCDRIAGDFAAGARRNMEAGLKIAADASTTQRNAAEFVAGQLRQMKLKAISESAQQGAEPCRE